MQAFIKAQVPYNRREPIIALQIPDVVALTEKPTSFVYDCVVVSSPTPLNRMDFHPSPSNSLPTTNLNRHNPQSKRHSVTIRVHLRSQQRDQIIIINRLTIKGSTNKNDHADIKHRIRPRHALQLPGHNLAHRLIHLGHLEDGILVEEPVIERGGTERPPVPSVPGHDRAVGGEMEGGGREAPLRRQVGGEDHDLEIAVAGSSGAAHVEVLAVEVSAGPRCDEVEI